MSLRSEIHGAFDELAPSNVGLEERVLATAAVDHRAKLRWTPRLRAPLSLVAVVLVIAVVAGALLSGRLLADWKRFTGPPAPAAPLTPLQKLEARPFKLPVIGPSGYCDQGPFDKNGDLGAGPVHFYGSTAPTTTSWGMYFYDSMVADGPVGGPILVRAKDLVTGRPIVFIGQYAAGPVIGTDVLHGQVVELHTELVVDSPTPPYAWELTAVTQNADNCEGWQVDGPGFTELART